MAGTALTFRGSGMENVFLESGRCRTISRDGVSREGDDDRFLFDHRASLETGNSYPVFPVGQNYVAVTYNAIDGFEERRILLAAHRQLYGVNRTFFGPRHDADRPFLNEGSVRRYDQ